MYVFGGITDDHENSNQIHAFNLNDYSWSHIAAKGTPPAARCMHKMRVLADNLIAVFGGVSGSFVHVDKQFNDIFLFNTVDDIWSKPIIGGLEPTPRFGFSLNKYTYKEKNMLLVFGGISATNDTVIYEIIENGKVVKRNR